MEEYNKYVFNEIFKENLDGSLTPIKTVQVNGIMVGPNVTFQKGVAFGGVDFHLYKNSHIAAKEENGILNIVGFFKEDTENRHAGSNL